VATRSASLRGDKISFCFIIREESSKRTMGLLSGEKVKYTKPIAIGDVPTRRTV
jgi:hypothetical protein